MSDTGAAVEERASLDFEWRVVVVVLMLALGCSSVSGRGSKPSAAAPEAQRVVRPEAPPDYDVLVGEFAAREARFEAARDAFARAVAKDPDSAALHAKLAQFEAQLDEPRSAMVHARRAVELDPENVPARIFLARLHRVNRDVEAMEEVLRGDDGEPIDTMAALMLYQAYIDTERFPEALVLAEQLAAEDSENVNGYIAIATIHERMGQYEEAEAALRAALELEPGDLTLYSRIARLHRTAGNREAEIALYQELLKDRPDHYATLVSLGEAQVAAGRVAEAIDTFRLVAGQYPDDNQILRRLASLYFAEQRYEEAGALLESAIAEQPISEELYYSLGQVQRAMGELDAALDSFAHITPGQPAYPEARLQIVAVYEELGDFEAAAHEVDAVLALRPSRALEFHYAGLLARAGRPEDGVARLEAMLAEKPDDEEILYQLGVLHGLMKQTDEALRYMHAALDLNPDNPNALNYIGYTFAEQGERLDEAEELIRRALELRPDDGYITDSLGWVYYMRAKIGDGVEYLEKAREKLTLAMELTGGDPVISEHLGDVYLLMDEKQRALEQYEEAVELEPRPDEQPNLMEKLEGLRRELGAR